MFHKFDHYWNLNCVFTRVYGSLSNKCKGIESLATLSDGLSININSNSFNFKWKLLEALPVKVKQEESAWWLFWWQCFLMAVASLSLYFDGFSVRIDFPKCSYWRTSRWGLADVNIIGDVAIEFVNYFRIHGSRDYIFETENISGSIWWISNVTNF